MSSKKSAGSSKKRKGEAKASKNKVAAAKQRVVDDQALTECPSTPVAVKAEKVSKRKVFTEDEDIAICKAWVNISVDSITGANQKGDHFWARVHSKFNQIHAEEAEVVVKGKGWPIKSVQDRFGKIEKEVVGSTL